MKRFRELELRHIYLQPGELFVDNQPALVQTILGSCVSVTLFCPRGGFGGICHALLPTGKPDEPGRHVDGAVRLLLDRMLGFGARHQLLEAKLFGGSRVLGVPPAQRLTVGEQNVACAKELLHKLNLQLVADDTGGLRGRMLFFNSGSGEVFIRKVRNSTLDDINQEVATHG
ncbi:chemotaxis protein CheD [Trichlorobacter sp.]|uniref:chemotaxis protein CheD n=1 Tax=Trichlorobacter sp. TaxID=2911007 RepID=UPI002A359B3D|nr:chemotaxis protein CheD [Trichlorobacter sp.]MDY0385160.1 chemotaxis protein CheD [Trichlorobacter sp.]